MKLMELQKHIAPHTKCSLYRDGDSSFTLLWSGEIEACDFNKYGNYAVTYAAYSWTMDELGFRLYLVPPPKHFGLPIF